MTKDSELQEGTPASQAEGSDNGNGQRGSSTDADLLATVQRLQTQIDQLNRSMQSDKDRAVKRTNERLDVLETDIRTVLQNAVQQGRSVGDLLGEIEQAEERETRQLMRDMAQSFKTGTFPAGVSGRQPDAQQGVNVSEVLDTLELDPNDTRVQAFRAKAFTSLDEAYREGALLRKTIKTTQPSDADKPSPVARTRVPASNQEELMQEYREGSKNLYGRQLLLYKARMREKGLEIT